MVSGSVALTYHVEDIVQTRNPLTLTGIETGDTEDGWGVFGNLLVELSLYHGR